MKHGLMKHGSPGNRLFVYGTLMSGDQSGGLLRGLPILPAQTRGRLYRMPAGYPVMVLDDDGPWVHGELVELDGAGRLMLLDSFEGVGQGLYTREVIRVAYDGRSANCWAYVMTAAQVRSRKAARLKGNNWRRYRWGRS